MALCVLANTKTMTETEWLELRKKGIGGSDAAASIGLNHYKSAVELWLEKTGQKEPDDLSDNEKVQWGKILEDVIAEEFPKRTGLKIRRCNHVLIHPKYDFMLANVDRVVVGKNEGVEIKNVGVSQAKNWDGDEVPDMYYIQCQHYCAVTGWDGVHIAALVGGQRFVTKFIPRNDEFIARMIEREKDFWKHVLNKTMPMADASEACSKALTQMHPLSNGTEIYLPETAELWAKQYQRACDDEKEAQNRKQEAQNVLQQMLGANEIGMVSDYKITWKSVKSRELFDKERFIKEYPGTYERFLKQGSPARRFSIR